MAKSSIIDGYTMFDSVDASTSQDTFSKPTNVKNLNSGSIQVIWTGTPVGALEVHVSNDKSEPSNWTKLDFGSTIAIDTTAEPLKTHLISLLKTPFSWLAL